MLYFKIDFQNFYNLGRVPSYANGDNIPNADYYLKRIDFGEILSDNPIFDYFFLESFDKEEYWEWKLCDAHGFIGEASRISACWFVSEDLKLLLENFNLAQPYCFYPSKLLYKGNKLNYFIFQFAGKLIIDKIRTRYINWSKSVFFNPIDESFSSINSVKEFIDEKKRIMKISKYDKEIKLRKLVLQEALDFFPMGTYLEDDLVSERLKQAMETMGITGFEFSELDYEVVVE